MKSFEDALAALDLRRDESAWRPRLFDACSVTDQQALVALIESGVVHRADDTIAAQLAELVEVRAPERKCTAAEIERAIEVHLAGRPRATYGTWVFYPWSERLIHVLPRDEYVEVRTSRNRNKITHAEQARLGELVVGIAGLSVGQSTAVTLALEGVGGHFRLADFDTINLSNLNRLRAGAQAIGVNKAVLTAREIFELNPYVEITIFPTGVVEENLDAFLGGLDLLFEECDDLKMKVRLREAARARRVPVLMETSDRGLFDVERFDREPDRPIFHGLTGTLRADELDGLTTFEKVPVVLKIIGEHTMSRRMAASLVDIESTIKSWPQLASAVALGGAVNTDAARRIALDQFRGSGRFFVDLEQLVSEGREEKLLPEAPRPPEPPARRAPPAELERSDGPLTASQLEAIVEHGTLAPSGGNAQPWQFRAGESLISCALDPTRRRTLLDYDDAASYLALGAAIENMCLAAGALGYATTIEHVDSGGAPTWRLHLTRTTAPPDPLVAQIAERATNRRIGARAPLGPARDALLGCTPGALQLLESPEALAELAEILGRADRLRFLSMTMHREMMEELRWSTEEAERTRDGIDVASLELAAPDLAGLRLVSRWPIMETLGTIGGGAGLMKATRKAITQASAVGLLSIEHKDPRHAFVDGGRLVERSWLTATGAGLAFQPMTPLVYLFARLERGQGVGLSPTEREELTALRARFLRLFEVRGRTELMLFRVGRSAPPSVRSLRLPLERVCRITK